jgi:hypothetical protein
MLHDELRYLDKRSSQLKQQVRMLLLEQGESQLDEDPMDIDLAEVPSPPDCLQIIQQAVSDCRLLIAPVQSPIQGKARSNSAFPDDMFPLPVMPPPPPTPQAPKTPSPPQRNPLQDIPHAAPNAYQMPQARRRDSHTPLPPP